MFGIVPVMHDSNGAQAFILEMCPEIRAVLPRPKLKYGWIAPSSSDAIIGMLNAEGVEFSISAPLERFHRTQGHDRTAETLASLG